MDLVLRASAVYFFLIVIFHFAGKRSLSEANTFDLVLLLILSEAVQQALVVRDHSLTGAFLVVTTLVGLEIAMSWVKFKWPKVETVETGGPVILVREGKPFEDRLRKSRVDIAEVLQTARRDRGLTRLDQIKYAILEASGEISIIGAEPARA